MVCAAPATLVNRLLKFSLPWTTPPARKTFEVKGDSRFIPLLETRHSRRQDYTGIVVGSSMAATRARRNWAAGAPSVAQ